MYNNYGLQASVQQAMMQNAGQQQNRNRMGMQQAFQPHPNPNMRYRPDPLMQNPQAFVQEAPNPYYTVYPDPSMYAPQISQGQYNAMMQQDYGQNPYVNMPQQPTAPAAPPQQQAPQVDDSWKDAIMMPNPIGSGEGYDGQWSYRQVENFRKAFGGSMENPVPATLRPFAT